MPGLYLQANVILATGASQFEMIENLIHVEGVDWSKVTCFHLDEYVGITDQHPASFKKYANPLSLKACTQPLPATPLFEGVYATPTRYPLSLKGCMQARIAIPSLGGVYATPTWRSLSCMQARLATPSL